ncbi:MAG TPA: DUF655 domain-containing protein [Myxococcota bacterium]
MKAFVMAMVLAVFAAVSAFAQEQLDVNTATKEQLEALPGIGAKVASEIVREREENGAFSSAEELQSRVPSLTPAVWRKAAAALKVSPAEQIVVQEGKVVSREVVKKILMRYAAEPTVREVQDAAVDYVRIHPETIDSWQTRARWRAIGPQLTASGEGGTDNSLRKVTNLDATQAEIDSTTDQNTGKLTLQARWDLDRLIFEPQEMNIAREAVRTANLRDRVLDEVTRRYFERRRLQVDLELSPPTDLGDRVRKELRLQELTADIDAFTGGFFSQKLEKAGRAPY